MKKFGRWLIPVVFMSSMTAISIPAHAENFSASFHGTDIHEFINTISKNLGKTIIIDNSVKGNISIRSYEEMDAEQYYQFFLNVLDVYGYSVISMPNNVLKVVPTKGAQRAALASLGTKGEGDEMVMRIVSLHHITAKDVAPMLRQLNESIGTGNVSYYEGGNSLLITGRADVVKGMSELVAEMDRNDELKTESVALEYASAADVVRMVNELLRKEQPGNAQALRIVADERTNSVLLSGDERRKDEVRELIAQLDENKVASGNTKVIHLKYAKASALVETLTGVSASLNDSKEGAAAGNTVSVLKNTVIKADDHMNALIINASPDVLRNLEDIVSQLDVRRPQVMVEAVIVELQDAEGLNLGLSWANQSSNAGASFGNTPMPYSGNGGMSEVLNRASGLVAGFYSGNWTGLLSAITSNSQNNILATPSIVTLDNEDAEFSVGQDVPVLSGSQTTNSDNIFNTVSRKTVGIKLKVKPQINKGNSVLLQIEQEVSSVAENGSADTGGLGATFNVRTLNNSVLVDSGKTVVVGGLLDSSKSESDNGVPYLSKIPVVGNLFKSSADKSSKRNLVLFIRPTIIRDGEDHAQQSVRSARQFEQTNREPRTFEGQAWKQLNAVQPENNTAFKQARQQISAFYSKNK
jgi:general secretion pathway protein D